jgi:hypothetical protein
LCVIVALPGLVSGLAAPVHPSGPDRAEQYTPGGGTGLAPAATIG